MNREYFIKDLRAAHHQVDGRLSAPEYDNISPHDHKTAAKYCGNSWNDAKREAGLKETDPGDGSAYGRMTTLDKRTAIYEMKDGLVCESCGEDRRYPAIEFHHKNAEYKEFAISDALSEGHSWKNIKAEISKCVPLCSSCHREVTAGLRKEPWEDDGQDS